MLLAADVDKLDDHLMMKAILLIYTISLPASIQLAPGKK
ncbi:unnamed protein product [Rhodiola kirilowii]